MNPRNCAIFLLYASAALFCVGEAMERSSSSGFHQGSTREEILANRARRKKQFETLFAEVRQQLLDHSSGKKILNLDELKNVEEKINTYQRKLYTMEGDVDEREVQRILQREERRLQRDEGRRTRRGENAA